MINSERLPPMHAVCDYEAREASLQPLEYGDSLRFVYGDVGDHEFHVQAKVRSGGSGDMKEIGALCVFDTRKDFPLIINRAREVRALWLLLARLIPGYFDALDVNVNFGDCSLWSSTSPGMFFLWSLAKLNQDETMTPVEEHTMTPIEFVAKLRLDEKRTMSDFEELIRTPRT